MVPSKLGDVWEPPLSPSTYDSNLETENSIVMHHVDVPNNDVDASEEYIWRCYMIMLWEPPLSPSYAT
jgi:hypothetical protein